MIFRKKQVNIDGSKKTSIVEEFKCSNNWEIVKKRKYSQSTLSIIMSDKVEVLCIDYILNASHFTLERDEAISAARAILRHFGESE